MRKRPPGVPDHAATAMALLESSIYLGSALGSLAGAAVLTVAVNLLGPAAGSASLLALVIHIFGSLHASKSLTSVR